MIHRLLLLAALSCFPSVEVMAAEPFARARIVTEGRIIAGERIELAVDVLVPNFFKAPPEFPLFDLENAIVILPDSRAVNLSDTSGGVQYSGIRRSYEIIPQVAGGYRLPEVRVAIAFAGDEGQLLKRTISVPLVNFNVEPVPGDWQGQQPFVATSVAVAETLDRDPAKLKAGDTIVRQITITADGTRAMMIPVPDVDTVVGSRLYRQDPILRDDPETGAGSRAERLTYLVEKQGEITLPSINLKWLDPANAAIQIASVPEVKLTISAAVARQAIALPSSEDAAARAAREKAINRYLGRIALVAVGALLIFAVLYWAGSEAEEFWRRAKKSYRQSERYYFRNARTALAGDDAMAAFQALERWTGKIGFRSVEEWARSTGDADIQRHVSALQYRLFGKPGKDEISFREIARLMTGARRQALASLHRFSRENPALPPLNP